MKDFFTSSNKYRNIALTSVISVLIIILGYEIITNITLIYTSLASFFKNLISTLSPVLFGIVIAYLLYKPCDSLFVALTKGKLKFFVKRERFTRVLCVFSVNLFALVIIALLFYAIIPNTVESITQIAARTDELVEPASKLIKNLADNPLFLEILDIFNIDIAAISPSKMVAWILTYAEKILDSVGTYLVGFVYDLGTFLYNFIFGFIISIYVNLEKELLVAQARKLLIALFGRFYDKVCEIGIYSDKMFFGYLKGKFLTSAIIGIVAYILCLILGVKYALLTGVLLAVTNLIPIFGPWLGAIPCVLFAILSGVKYAVYVALIAFLTQQLDNNIIGPKIIGDNVNLNGFWVLVSIIVCGKLWGLMGMIIAIPLFAVLKKLTGEVLAYRITKLKLSVSPEQETTKP